MGTGTESVDPLAGIIAQVDRDGHQTTAAVPSADIEEVDVQQRRTSIFRKFFCGCFSPLLSNEHGPFPNSGLMRIGSSRKDSQAAPLLPVKSNPNKITLILDLDETLVHSSFTPVPNPDFVIPVEVDGTVHRVFVCKRPGVDDFMKKVGELFEVVVFTASLDKYANPVLDLLDTSHSVHFRLFRDACVTAGGQLVKDLTRLGRDIKQVIILDNSPTSYMLQPQNAVPISSWFDDMDDIQLNILLPWFVDVSNSDDVLPVLSELRGRMMAGFSVGPPQTAETSVHGSVRTGGGDHSTHGVNQSQHGGSVRDASVHGLGAGGRDVSQHSRDASAHGLRDGSCHGSQGGSVHGLPKAQGSPGVGLAAAAIGIDGGPNMEIIAALGGA